MLLQIERAQRADDPGHLVRELVGDPGHLGEHDRPLALERRVVEVEEQTAPLQGLGELAGVVGGEEDERDLIGPDRPELGDRDLVVREDLQQERLGLDLEAIDLVDEQHDRVARPDGLEQGAGQEELLGEQVLLERLPARWPHLLGVRHAFDLDAEELFFVVPLVERLGLVQPLVALQPDQPGTEDAGRSLGELCLARSGGTLDKDRLCRRSARYTTPVTPSSAR